MSNNLSIRRTQLIVPFGTGSIINLPDDSLMTCSIDMWDDALVRSAREVHDLRLERNLQVSCFRLPPSSDEAPAGIPFVRFPEWLFCPGCRVFQSVYTWEEEWKNKRRDKWDYPQCLCNASGIKLIPSRFIVACSNGHIADFPWIEWVHNNRQVCDNPRIKFRTGRAYAGLRGIELRCDCGAWNTMEGTFNPDFFREKLSMKCNGRKPWAGTSENCNLYPRTLQRGSSNVYFPRISSSIHIPPFSDKEAIRIQNTPEWKIIVKQQTDPELRKMLIKDLINKSGGGARTETYIERMLSSDTEHKDRIDYRYQEYQAFLAETDKNTESSEDFETEILTGSEYRIEGIENIVLVKRLRELKVLTSFSRITPIFNDSSDSISSDSENQIVREVKISEDSSIDWLPCCEVRGEGIFIQLNDEALEKWAAGDRVNRRCSLLERNLRNKCERRGIPVRSINPQFILLHTLAHVLIRRLSFECGYASASLCERIYCNENDQHDTMNAVLIYTAAGDSSGTLGGLVRQGRPDVFSDIFLRAIRDSIWCSSDPICINSSGQGNDSLNLGACHSCALLPETSCEEFNSLLDRAVLIGKPDDRGIGFFNKIVSIHL